MKDLQARLKSIFTRDRIILIAIILLAFFFNRGSFNLSSFKEFLLTIPVLMVCFSVHELSHGLVAYALGDNTAKRDGRLSLNPLRHIDWFGFLMLVTVRIGWAKPVPVNPRYFKNPKQGMALTALAGPVSNILLAFISAFLWALMLKYKFVIITPYFTRIVRTALELLIIYNCALAVFNLLPVPPLDGSKVVGALLPDRAYFTYLQYERYGMIILVLLIYTGVLSGMLSNANENLGAGIFWIVWRLMGLLP